MWNTCTCLSGVVNKQVDVFVENLSTGKQTGIGNRNASFVHATVPKHFIAWPCSFGMNFVIPKDALLKSSKHFLISSWQLAMGNSKVC